MRRRTLRHNHGTDCRCTVPLRHFTHTTAAAAAVYRCAPCAGQAAVDSARGELAAARAENNELEDKVAALSMQLSQAQEVRAGGVCV